MNERIKGYLWIFVIYVIAASAGIALFFAFFHALSLPFWLSLLLADISSTLLVFAASVLFHNASVYDPYWSVQPIVIVAALAIRLPVGLCQILFLLPVLIWGIRLTANWAYTFRGMKFQDWRYTILAEQTKKLYPLVNLFGIHLVPTLIVYGCILPAVFVFLDSPAPNAGLGFLLVSVLAVLLQGTADIEMHRFRKKRGHGFLRKGLWKYSRHPNYLGEILMWWGIALAAVCLMPHRWYLLSGALLNTLLFLFVSIPMADRHQARKEGFPQYKQSTRMLLPIYKRPISSSDQNGS